MEQRPIDANELLRCIGAKPGIAITKTEIIRMVETQPNVEGK